MRGHGFVRVNLRTPVMLLSYSAVFGPYLDDLSDHQPLRGRSGCLGIEDASRCLQGPDDLNVSLL